MKLKPSLFQLSVVLMVSSLLASLLAACNTNASRPECQVPAEQRPPNCSNYSGGTSTIYRSGGSSYRRSGGSSTGRSNVSPGSRSNSSGSKSTTTGRSGFGSFGRGGSSS